MKVWQFKGILTETGWLLPGYLESENGKTISVNEGVKDGLHDYEINGYLLPGFQNAHSHAFQYGMAGISENRVSSLPRDNFWSWREAMYDIALKIDPDQLGHIAAMVYSEMAKHGYTSVAEFHYLHHDKNGNPYDNPAEHGIKLVEAAKIAGIRITLVPVFYQTRSFGIPATKSQRRFVFPSFDAYYNLIEHSGTIVNEQSHASLGVGVHSLRAVIKDDLLAIVNSEFKELPFHLHISEQIKEVEDCLKFYGKRPVEWIFDNISVDKNFHLVHSTHLSDQEVNDLAESNAQVVLCPTTEGNLGDGIFPLKKFQNSGGNWSIGTDSHVSLNPMEELRLLDYGQRLISHERNTYHHGEDSGFFAFSMAWKSGRRAMGLPDNEFFKTGDPFDGLIIRHDNPLIGSTSAKNLLSTILYSSDLRDYTGTIVDGKWLVKDGIHINRNSISINFLKVLQELGIR